MLEEVEPKGTRSFVLQYEIEDSGQIFRMIHCKGAWLGFARKLMVALSVYAGVAKLENARGLGPRGVTPWGFDSLRPHQ